MVYSFLGLSKPVTAFGNLLKEKVNAWRYENYGFKPMLEAGGVYTGTLSSTMASFAADNDMCVYTALEDLLDKSDIIFVFLSNSSLKSISLKLGRHPLKGKVFCHFGPAYTADILDYCSYNTYVSMHIPYFIKDKSGNLSVENIIAEGYGKKLDSLKSAFAELGIKCTFVSREEKMLYLTALDLVKNMSSVLNTASGNLLKYSLASDKAAMSDILKYMYTNPASINSYDSVDASDVDFASRQIDVLQSLGIDEINKLYASLLNMSAINSGENETNETIRRMVKRLFNV